MNVKDIRVARLRELLDAPQFGKGKQTVLAKKIKKAPAQISQWLNGTRTMEEDSAREIEKHAKLKPGWLDEPVQTPLDDEAINAVVFSDLLQRLPEADRHVLVTVAYHSLNRNAALFAEEEVARYDAALKALDTANKPAN